MAEKTHILLIEDDRRIANFVTMALKAKGYGCTVAADGNEGILLFCTNNPGIVLLDLGLPDGDGMAVLLKIREVSQTPVIIVSAREQETDKIRALDAGANDYVTKPFHMGELLARIRVMERLIERQTVPAQEAVFQCDNLKVDYEKRRILIDDTQVHLTPIEYKLLVHLIANRGKVLTHSQISRAVWGYDDTGDSKSIRVYMASLRRKIEKNTAQPRFIQTEVGVGYRFSDE